MRRLLAAVGAVLLLGVLPALLALFFAGAPGLGKITLRETAFSALDGWDADRQDEAFFAFLKSCEALQQRSASPLRAACAGAGEAEALVRRTPALARAFFEENFTPYLVRVGWRARGLLTGYYEPLIEASLTPDPAYPYPLYGRPADQVVADLKAFRPELSGRLVGRLEGNRLVPYPDRAAIEAGALSGRNLEILWAQDPVDVFFLQVQGSGRARLPDGSMIRVGYAGGNGRPYTSIGRVLIDMGALAREEVSLFSIRAWLEANPEQLAEILNRNESFVFFQIGTDDGPVGSAGSVLTPMRSLAVDPAHVALGLPVWVETTVPDRAQPFVKDVPFRRLLVAEDTGGAIKGAMRGDLFFGFGSQAEWQAGHMKNRARFYVLLPKEVDAP